MKNNYNSSYIACIQYNPSNTATLGTQQNGPIWGVALLEGWAIPDAIEIGGKKTRKRENQNILNMFNNQVVFVSRKYFQKHRFIFFNV